jgi:putative DNA primase/helicase
MGDEPTFPAPTGDPPQYTDEDIAEPAADPMPDEPHTEYGYARRLVDVYGDRLRFVPAWRRWLVWDGTRWAHDDSGQAHRWMKATARRLTVDAMSVMDADRRRAALRETKRAESAAGVAAALTLAGTEREVVVTPDQLDADPFLLNCANGTLDLRTLELRKHDPADLLTKVTGAAYDPDAAGAEWSRFLARVQPDAEMRAYLARLHGHALEGRVVEHVLPIHWGEGANGKGTFLTAVKTALGDYADAADPDLLTARTYDAHPTGVADLFGLRLAILHETDRGRYLAEGTVKRLTGGDRVKARRMREDFWSFDPAHTFVILTNHKPRVGGTDEAIWRRLRLIPWPVVIPATEQDGHLGDLLAVEADAVLAWLVAGYRDWREHGLADPDPVTDATKDYRDESDALGRFLDQRCLLMAAAHVRSSELYAEWRRWCAAQGEEPDTDKAFTRALQGRGYDTRRTKIGAVWDGIGLAADDQG